MGKTNPLNDRWPSSSSCKRSADSPKSWSVDASDLDPTFDLSVKNPNGNEAVVHRSPRDILDEIAELDAESAEVLGRIRGVV
jgi:type I restriction enzyme M protein